MVMIAAGREKGGGAVGVEQIEAEKVAVEMNCPVEIGDFQVNVADVRSGGDGRLGR